MTLPSSVDGTVVMMEYQEMNAVQKGAVIMTKIQKLLIVTLGALRHLQAMKAGPSNCELQANCQHGVHTKDNRETWSANCMKKSYDLTRNRQ